VTREARTPEELEALFEDAFVTRDAEALSAMFAEGGVLAIAEGHEAARGAEQIGHLAIALWESDRTYVADPRRVLQARDTALVLASRGINVARRGRDGSWRYTIAFLLLDSVSTKEEQ
jgi:hypothetical protein